MRGIGLGLVTSRSGRIYPDDPCPTAMGYVDDFGGVIQNNFISASDLDLFASEYGFECGVCVWNACNAQVLHNRVYTADPVNTFSSVEWRFSNTKTTISNNLSNHLIRERDGADAVQSGNLTTAAANWFEDVYVGDLHLTSKAVEAIDQVIVSASVNDDIDGDSCPIGTASDIGADEYGESFPVSVNDLFVSSAITNTGSLSITLVWSPPAGAESQKICYASDPITKTSWDSATLLVEALSGHIRRYQTSIPFNGNTLYFAHKSENTAGVSALSNITLWPRFDVYLPVTIK